MIIASWTFVKQIVTNTTRLLLKKLAVHSVLYEHINGKFSGRKNLGKKLHKQQISQHEDWEAKL